MAIDPLDTHQRLLAGGRIQRDAAYLHHRRHFRPAAQTLHLPDQASGVENRPREPQPQAGQITAEWPARAQQ